MREDLGLESGVARLFQSGQFVDYHHDRGQVLDAGERMGNALVDLFVRFVAVD